jgi:filamentous hemagglutinin family protein
MVSQCVTTTDIGNLVRETHPTISFGDLVMKSSIFLVILSISLLITVTVLRAEVTLDGTLGPSSALSGPDYAIGAELGQQRGNNLFHSFERFNLTAAESATFSGSDTIGNIISRVTGGMRSDIDGTIRSTIPNADMYFLNPYGIVFGPNAKLDVLGSFHASTADTLRFSDGSQFNARNPAASLLTVAPISAFGFLTDSPQPLSLERSRFTAPVGKTFSFIGGTVQINRAVIRAAAGRINIAGVATQGDVTLQDLTLSSQAGDVTIQNALVSISGGGSSGGIYIRAGQFVVKNTPIQANTRSDSDAGEINVQANNLIATEGGRFLSQTRGSGQGGKIKIQVTGLTEFSGESVDSRGTVRKSGISMESTEDGSGGNLELETGTLELKDGGYISASTLGLGQGGNLNINATDTITISGVSSDDETSQIATNTYGEMENAGSGGIITLETMELQILDGATITASTTGTAQGGQINIGAMNLQILNGATITAFTSGTALGGQINISVTEQITLSGQYSYGYPSINTVTYGNGKGGTLILTANQLRLIDGAIISADSWGTGQGGNIQVQANDLVKIEGVDSEGYGGSIVANSNSEEENAGNSGTVEVTAGRLQLKDGSQIGASTFGSGNAGNVKINVTKEVSISGIDQSEDEYTSGIFSSSNSEYDDAGHAGSIVLTAGNLLISDHGNINATTYGPGFGGNISIQAQNMTLIGDSFITAYSGPFDEDDSSTSDISFGDAGLISLDIGNLLIMRDSRIETSAKFSDGGNLVINAPGYVYLRDSRVTTSVSEEFGNGGNLTVSPKFVIVDNSQVFAKAKKGAGGNIEVTTTGIYNFTGEPIAEIISASSEFGVDGVVTINTPDNSSQEGIFTLPANFFDATALMNSPCGQRVAENLSSFVIVESEGTQVVYNDLLPSGPLLTKSLNLTTRTAMERQNLTMKEAFLFSGCDRPL